MTSVSLSQVLVRIRTFRTHRGWARSHFASLAGLAEATVRGIDNEAWNPTRRTLEKLEALIPSDWTAASGQPAVAQGDTSSEREAA